MVKCADCGYLSVRSRVDHSLGDATIDFRERGAVPNRTDDRGMNPNPLHEKIPLCFAGQTYLGDAIKNVNTKSNLNDEVKTIINKEIDCKEFTKWRQGFTPKEHREMIDREGMQKREEERRRNDRKWHWVELIAIIMGTGLFTLLGAWIAKGQ